MAYISIAIPAPAANGSGAAVDMSSFGAEKTITVTAGGNSVLRPSVVIELSNQLVPTKWAPVAFFAPGGETTVVVAARWMRATVQNFKGGSAPTIDVGGEGTGTSFATLVAPAGVSGVGAGVDVSALPLFKTVHVAGSYQGALNIEISQDGGATYQQAFSFPSNTAGIQSKQIAADFMRVTRNGVPTIQPGTPIINIGATDLSGGGGGGGALAVQDEGSGLGSFPTMNFTGGGVTASDAGGGVVEVHVPAPVIPPAGVSTDASLLGDGDSIALGTTTAGVNTGLRPTGSAKPTFNYYCYEDFVQVLNANWAFWGNGPVGLARQQWGANDTDDAIGYLDVVVPVALVAAGDGLISSVTTEKCFRPLHLQDLWMDTRVNPGAIQQGLRPAVGLMDALDPGLAANYAWFTKFNLSPNWQFEYVLETDAGVQTGNVDTGIAVGSAYHRFFVRIINNSGTWSVQCAVDGNLLLADNLAGTPLATVGLQDAVGLYLVGEVIIVEEAHLFCDWVHLNAKRLVTIT